jgi:hypothetical protein
VQPRQAPDWTLHLVAWRAVALLFIGKWDECALAADRAYALWNESGRPAAGYSLRGFTAGTIVAHAQRDDVRAARCSDAIDEIGGQFARRARHSRAVAAWDIGAIAETIAGARPNYDAVAMSMSICADAGQPLDADFLASTRELAAASSATLLHAQCLRALGLASSNVALLDEARQIFQESGSLPYLARVRCEAAIMHGDKAELDAGLTYLESIRDITQVERYLKASRHAAGR